MFSNMCTDDSINELVNKYGDNGPLFNIDGIWRIFLIGIVSEPFDVYVCAQ